MSCSFEVTPISQSTEQKKSKIFNLNYTNQDYASLKTRLADFMIERFGENGTELPNTFNDLSESSVAIMLMEIYAFIGDLLSFKVDQNFGEIFIDSVTEVENAFRIARQMGFQPTPPIAGKSMWIAQLNNVQTEDVVISTPVIIDLPSDIRPTSIELFAADSTGAPIFDEDIIIPAGGKFNKSIVGIEGRTRTEIRSGTGVSSQSIQLGYSPVLYDSIRVTVDGIIWEQVEYFTDSQPRTEYRLEFDSSYQAFIIFGNNRAGAIPSKGSIIEISYRIGGGTVGNITTGSIETTRQVTVDGLSFPVPVFYKNYTKGEYGYDGDGIEEVRRKLPEWLRTQNRAVTGEDYKTLVEQFATPYYGQIGKATAVLRNYGCSGNIIDLYVLAKDSSNQLTEASTELKYALKQELDDKKMFTDYICIKDGETLIVDVSIDLTLDKFNKKFEKEIRERVVRNVNDFFSINNWDYNKVLKDTDLIKHLSEIREIQTFQINFTLESGESSTTITPEFYQIVRPDTTTLTFIYD